MVTNLGVPSNRIVDGENKIEHGAVTGAGGTGSGSGGNLCRGLGLPIVEPRLLEHAGSIRESVLHWREGGQHSVQNLGWFAGLHGLQRQSY